MLLALEARFDSASETGRSDCAVTTISRRVANASNDEETTWDQLE